MDVIFGCTKEVSEALQPLVLQTHAFIDGKFVNKEGPLY